MKINLLFQFNLSISNLRSAELMKTRKDYT